MALHALLRRNLTSFFSENLLSPTVSNGSLSLHIAYFSTAMETKPSTTPSVYEFLTNKHQFPPQVASRAASILSPSINPEKYDSVLSFFKQIGFTKSHLERILINRPHLLAADLEKIIKPKIKVFQDNGFPSDDITAIISKEPMILHVSLENKLVPALSWLKDLFGSIDKVARALRKSGWLLLGDLENITLPNVQTLMNRGMSRDQVVKLINYMPRAILYNRETLSRCLENMDKMDVVWTPKMYIYAVATFCSMTGEAWERKLQAFREILEFSQDDIVRVLRKSPTVFCVSQDKMRIVKKLLLGTGKYDASSIAEFPRVLLFSIEKRCKPRFEVLGMLESRGLIEEWPSLCLICSLTDEQFFEDYSVAKERANLCKLVNGIEAFCFGGVFASGGE
ncbi:mitochondrial transcription termination factorfamily protein, partial [Striga asiatica]